MSYNVDSTEYIEGTGPLTITRDSLRELRAALGDRAAEVAWFDPSYEDDTLAESSNEPLVLECPWWYGSGSGPTIDAFAQSLAYTRGSADILVTWARGDAFSGLRVRDGVVTRHVVVHSLGEEEKA